MTYSARLTTDSQRVQLASYSESRVTYSIVRASFGHGGWVGLDGLDLPGPLYVRLRPDPNNRLRIKEFYIDASQGEAAISHAALRELPLGQIEAWINAHREQVERKASRPSPDLSKYATFFSSGFDYARSVEGRHWVAISFAEQLPDDRLEAGHVPEFPRVERVERAWRDARDSKEEAEFRLPPGGPPNGLTDDFLQDVAKAYAAAVARRERPNVALAKQTGAPVKSVQRWVYTARQRGIMPRGSRGRPG